MTRRQPTAEGPLAGHVQAGRRYLPWLASSGVLQLGDWVRDDLPDLLWPVLLLGYRDTAAARDFVRWQSAVQADLRGFVSDAELASSLDGRLTGLDRLAELRPSARDSIKNRAAEFDLLPDPVAAALASYADRPAAWLVERDFSPPSSDELTLVALSLIHAIRDGHREAVIKCLSIWSAVQAGTFSSDAETIALLRNYPTDAATRSQADSVVRACWGAARGRLVLNTPDHFDDTIRWAKLFWGVNSMTSRCIRRRDVDEESDEESAEGDSVAGSTASADADLQGIAMDLVSSYVEALETAPARLYDQERQEVHAGLVSRAGREVIAALGYPDLWCLEHGSHVVRTLVEVRIQLEWMATQSADIYRRFQEYGSGKAKLYARILEELPPDARIAGFDEAIGELDRLSHNDEHIDYRIVDTSDSFAGTSIRSMAEECGLLDLYRHAYYIASGVAHSEWWSVETHAMERCLNVLHRGHLIPSLALSSGGNVPLARSWLDHLYALTQRSLSILGTEPSAVAAAFAWMADDDSDRRSDGLAT